MVCDGRKGEVRRKLELERIEFNKRESTDGGREKEVRRELPLELQQRS